jgi:hypothetical protein
LAVIADEVGDDRTCHDRELVPIARCSVFKDRFPERRGLLHAEAVSGATSKYNPAAAARAGREADADARE